VITCRLCYARVDAVTKKTPTPAQGIKMPSGVHAMRRGGARREVTERVTLKSKEGETLEGWALNVSRGGVRAILEEKVVLGQTFDVAIGTDDLLQRPSRVVWVQEEPDGVIVGLEFTSMSGTHKSAPPPAPGAGGSDAAPDADTGGRISED
jgi:PilZ domain-containing protein